MALDCFRAAIRIPNSLRNVIGESGLARVFLPVYSEVKEKKGVDAANSFVATLFILVTIVLTIVSLLFFIFAKDIIYLITSGWRDMPEKIELTTHLLRFFSFYILFIGFICSSNGLSQFPQNLFLPAVAPAVYNLIWLVVLYMFILSRRMMLPKC
jgi:putative peptidoglycan lipid II flippase